MKINLLIIFYVDKQQNYLFQSNELRLPSNRYSRFLEPSILTTKINSIQYGTSQKYQYSENKDCYTPPPSAKPTVFQRMKQMTKDYWHILIPVHIVTSTGWLALFYMAAKKYIFISIFYPFSYSMITN